MLSHYDRCHDRNMGNLYLDCLDDLSDHMASLIRRESGLYCGPGVTFALTGIYDPGWADMNHGHPVPEYDDIAHVMYAYYFNHLPVSERRTAIVLPPDRCRQTVHHEMGHVLHSLIGWEVQEPVTEYGETNQFEAFADNFVVWLYEEPEYVGLTDADKRTFEELYFGA